MSKALISFRRIDHVSWTVAAIEPVVEFYSRVFGVTPLYAMGPLDAADIPRDAQGRDWTEAHLGVPGGRLSLAMLQFPDGFRLELFEYGKPAGASTAPLPCNEIGSHHLGIEVDDLEQAASVLLENGCTVYERIALDEGPTAGSSFRYFRDPWGNIFELCQHTQR
ncbi:VOC family protein [Massilia aurea]|uniref:VOC family protein n=1 Tax=Massilia aurea TaxID=373040 RepID=UPI003462ABFA